jgi:hypothetical protein
MNIHRYVIFENSDEANALIYRLDQALGGDHWADANLNPFDGRALVAWNDDYLSKFSEMIAGFQTISLDEAQDEGWAFGYFSGRFAKSRVKLEEAQHIRVSLDSFDRQPNYPAYRALFFGLLSSLYGVKEALRQSCKKTSKEALAWWNLKFEEIKADPLLCLFYDLNNSDKHSISSPLLRPRMNLYGYKGVAPQGLIISGEGVFFSINQETPQEKRIFFDGADATFEVYLDISNLSHKGQDVSNICLKGQLDLAITHYENLVFEARRAFD